MQRVFVTASIATCLSLCLVGCGDSGPVPPPSPSPSPTPAPTPPTPAPLTCKPGNDLDQCHLSVGVLKEIDCTLLGTIGCDQSRCLWDQDASGEDKCQSAHATTTPAPIPTGPCVPGTPTDGCFYTGHYVVNADQCRELGPIGCSDQVCSWIDNVCKSAHQTTTAVPCEPRSATDKCYTKCLTYCHGDGGEASCVALAGEGCLGSACEWKVSGSCNSFQNDTCCQSSGWSSALGDFDEQISV